MASQFYWGAILLQETREPGTNRLVEPAKVLVEPKWFLASSHNQANMIMNAEVPEDVRTDPNLFDRVEVAVNPF